MNKRTTDDTRLSLLIWFVKGFQGVPHYLVPIEFREQASKIVTDIKGAKRHNSEKQIIDLIHKVVEHHATQPMFKRLCHDILAEARRLERVLWISQ